MENAFGQPQTVVVLGGTSDIARALTRKLCAARTHTVVLCGRNTDLLEVAAAEAREYGATRVETIVFDAEDPADAPRCVKEAFARVEGAVDLVVMAVGLLGDQRTFEGDPVVAARMATVNFTWPVAALTALRAPLVAQGSGRILVMSSVAAVRVRASMYLYGGAKAGLDRLCVAMAESLEGTGVTLQVLRPGQVRTKMTTGVAEAPFTTGPNEVAQNIMAGLASGDRVIWSPPLLRYVFFVLRHLPAPLWRKVMDR